MAAACWKLWVSTRPFQDSKQPPSSKPTLFGSDGCTSPTKSKTKASVATDSSPARRRKPASTVALASAESRPIAAAAKGRSKRSGASPSSRRARPRLYVNKAVLPHPRFDPSQCASPRRNQISTRLRAVVRASVVLVYEVVVHVKLVRDHHQPGPPFCAASPRQRTGAVREAEAQEDEDGQRDANGREVVPRPGRLSSGKSDRD
ncbi:hypothetical protein M885DRAFT_344431 [Pelagophyceae sp. CCMP2097]|nr:hypothetical protein M885DRAFT_344431 [Pelagophyceae sp. CCMP2097]